MRNHLTNFYQSRVLTAVLLDLAAFVLAATAVWWIFEPPFHKAVYSWLCAATALGCTTILYYTDAYGLGVLGSGRRTLAALGLAIGAVTVAVVTSALVFPFPDESLQTAARVAGFYAPALLVSRVLFRILVTLPTLSQRVLLLGNSDLSRAIARSVGSHRNLGTDIVGFLSGDPEDLGAWIEGIPVLGRPDELDKLLDKIPVDRIVVASKRRDEHFPDADLLRQKLLGLPIESGVSFYEQVTGRIYLRDLRPSYLIFNGGFALNRISIRLKRAMDIAAALVGLMFAGPVIGLAALAVRLDSPGPIFFGQTRVGLGGDPFMVWKLRSMRDDAEKETGAVWAAGADDDRITRVGRILRPSRIDELPQLWNVLRGEMSLVGPRPERPEFVEMLTERYPYFKARSAIRPGITGWAQIREGYVNEIADVEEKLALDFYYLKYRSLVMDLLILWKTVKTVVLLRGI